MGLPNITVNPPDLGDDDSLRREDINELDSDSAHFQQGTGKWDANGGAVSVSSDVPAEFGTTVFKQVMSGATSQVTRTPSGLAGFPIVPNEPLYISGFVRSAALLELQIGIQEFDAAGVSLGAGGNGIRVPTTDSMVERKLSITTDPLAAFARLTVNYFGAVGGEELYMSAWMLTQTAVRTFVPSIRIVGDMDLRVLCSSLLWGADSTRFLAAIADQNQGRRSFVVQKITNGNLRWTVTVEGGLGGTLELGNAFVDETFHELRFTRVASSGDLEVFFDNVSAATGPGDPGPGAIVAAPFPLQIATGGSNAVGAGSQRWSGSYEFLEYRDGLDGAIVYRMDANDLVAEVS